MTARAWAVWTVVMAASGAWGDGLDDQIMVDASVKGWPAAVRAYVPLMRGAEAYEAGRTTPVVVCDETFDDAAAAAWRIPDDVPMAAAELTTLEGRSVLRVQTDGKRAGWIAVGPPIKGDYRIDLIGRSLAEAPVQPCDLSVFGGRIGYAPGLQFGAWFNRRNLVWVARPDAAVGAVSPTGEPVRTHREVELPLPPRIELGRWHHVRMEVASGRIRGWVDGELLVDRAVGPGAGDEVAQPHVYIYGTTAALDRVTVTQPRPLPAAEEAALFEACFNGRSRADVSRELDEVAALLDHADWPVREAAQHILAAALPLSREALQPLLITGTPEQQHRTRRILGY